jgi:hypothetical protein
MPPVANSATISEYMRDEVLRRYDQPFMTSVSALPRQDLAKMAEALVALTAFLMRMNAETDETVAEPIDVAVLSKGDGFVWVKDKDLIQHGGMPPRLPVEVDPLVGQESG